jgi:peptide chain release factor 3
VSPLDPEAFSGFVFKIQANMDPKHRDRIAFVRVCSGRFESGELVTNVRSGKPVRLTRPQQFFAQEREAVETAWPGDVVGIHDRGSLRIGDTLSATSGLEFRRDACLLAGALRQDPASGPVAAQAPRQGIA